MYRRLIPLLPKSKVSLLLDEFPSLLPCYSIRKLRTNYVGFDSNVLRSVDSLENNFGFNNYRLNTSLVSDFVGYNLWTYSEQLQQTIWIKEGTTITPDFIIAPNGTLTADVVYETATLMAHSLRRIRQVTIGEEYTVSFYVKPYGRDFINVRAAVQMSTNGLTQPTSWVDLSTGLVTSNSGSFRIPPSIIDVGNGWFFIEFGTVASATANVTNFQILTSPNGRDTNYIGDVTKGVAIWGVQISQTSTLKPYQKTEATTGGRGSIATFYDQSQSNNLIQATLSRQPILINNSIINTIHHLPAFQGGTTIGLNNSLVNFSSFNELWFFVVLEVTSLIGTQFIIEHSANFNSNNRAFGFFIEGGVYKFSQRRLVATSTDFTVLNSSNPVTIGRKVLTLRLRSVQPASNSFELWENGISVPMTVIQNNPSVDFGNYSLNLFARNGSTLGFSGKYQEVLCYGGNQSANRLGIQQNINKYYGGN